MNNLYVDITNFNKSAHMTGIQRVVSKVLEHMGPKTDMNIVTLDISANDFDMSQLKAGDIWFDIDAVWHNLEMRRSYLYPELKAAGVRIATYIYDLIPITMPQYCHEETVLKYMDYIGAVVQYADVVIASAQATIDDLNELTDELGLKRLNSYVSWLSYEKKDNDGKNVAVDDRLKMATTNPYILVVGTLEPRKNHAFLLDAFEEGLFSKGLNLVFAGKKGWNIDSLIKRIDNSQYKDKQLFHLEGLDDAQINYLYEHAFLVANPSFKEGFGLPLIEAMSNGVPVLAADIPVFKEICGDTCEYFNNTSTSDFIDLVEKYVSNKAEYEKLKNNCNKYEIKSWNYVSDKILEALNSLNKDKFVIADTVKQMVVLTARVESFSKMIPFVDAFMPFITEMVVCCPDKVKDEMLNCYSGRIKLKTLCDSEVLNGRSLPDDHGTRNFMLRCMIIQNSVIDDAFIMSDDDYRPLKTIDISTFIKDKKYRAYYFYDFRKWMGASLGNKTSFDWQQIKTESFLSKNKYPMRQYASHMPQIIDKRLFLEMIDDHPGIEYEGICEWGSYFNYAQFKYPESIESLPYVTMGWPGKNTDWPRDVKPTEYLFENYYDFNYEQGTIFDGFSEEYFSGIEAENEKKVKKYDALMRSADKWQEDYHAFENKYRVETGQWPSVYIKITEFEVEIHTPKYIEFDDFALIKVPVKIDIDTDGFEIGYDLLDKNNNVVLKGLFYGRYLPLIRKELATKNNVFNLPMNLLSLSGCSKLILKVIKDNQCWSKMVPVIMHSSVLESIKGKNIIIFGAGKIGKEFFNNLPAEVLNRVKCFCDNGANGKVDNLDILKLEEALNEYPNSTFVITAKFAHSEIYNQLLNAGVNTEQILDLFVL